MDVKNKDAAFERIYYEYYPKLYRFFQKNCSSAHTAEDLTQETLLSFYGNFESYNPERASLSTWIYVIAKNNLRNWYRTRSRKPETELEEEKIEKSQEVTNELEEASILEEKKSMLFSAVETLPERDQKIVKMHYFQEKTSIEIADSLGMTPGSVRVALNRALKKIRTFFEEHGYDLTEG